MNNETPNAFETAGLATAIQEETPADYYDDDNCEFEMAEDDDAMPMQGQSQWGQNALKTVKEKMLSMAVFFNLIKAQGENTEEEISEKTANETPKQAPKQIKTQTKSQQIIRETKDTSVPVTDLLKTARFITLYVADFTEKQINDAFTDNMNGEVVRVCLEGATEDIIDHVKRFTDYLTLNKNTGCTYKTFKAYKDNPYNNDFYFAPEYFAISQCTEYACRNFGSAETQISLRTLDYNNLLTEKAHEYIHAAIEKGEVLEFIVNPPTDEEAYKAYNLIDGVIKDSHRIGRPYSEIMVYEGAAKESYQCEKFNLYLAPVEYSFETYIAKIIQKTQRPYTNRYGTY